VKELFGFFEIDFFLRKNEKTSIYRGRRRKKNILKNFFNQMRSYKEALSFY
jgi:hypothetical protein